jgi:hypothetical protein
MVWTPSYIASLRIPFFETFFFGFFPIPTFANKKEKKGSKTTQLIHTTHQQRREEKRMKTMREGENKVKLTAYCSLSKKLQIAIKNL